MKNLVSGATFALPVIVSAGAVLARILAVAAIIVTLPAIVQRAGAQKQPDDAAKLQRVDEGVFDLKEGQVLDLTDRRILLAFPKMQGNEIERFTDRRSVRLSINGRTMSLSQGRRFDLKRDRNTAKTLSDKAECYLDLLNTTAPKGSTPFATIRFVCQ